MIGLFSRNKHRVLLFIIVVLALALRLYGIDWGLPDASRPTYSYHPDEALHLFSAERLVTGTIHPKQFIYGGSFYFALLNAISYVAERGQFLLGNENLLADTILLGRYMMAGVALLTILLVYVCGRDLFGRPAGLVAALFLAVSPAHVVWAQRLRPDEIGVLVVAILLFIAIRILRNDPRHGLRNFVYAGLTLGVALALRFPLVIFILLPLIAAWHNSEGGVVRARLRSLLDRRIMLMGFSVVIGYVLASPQSFMYPEMFLEGLKVQWLYQSEPFVDAVGMGPGIYQYGWLMLHQALGYGLYILAVLGCVYALARRTPADLMLVAAVAAYLIVTSFTSWVVVRYTLPLLPLLVLLAARVAVQWGEARSSLGARVARASVVSAVVAVTLAADLAYLRLEAGTNVRELATKWIEKNIPTGASIALARAYLEDNFFNPVVPPGYRSSFFLLRDSVDSTAVFRGNRHDYLVLHEYFYKNMERLGDAHPSPEARRFHHALKASPYRLVAEFKQPVSFLGIDFSSWFSSNDYTIPNPGIRIYRYQG